MPPFGWTLIPRVCPFSSFWPKKAMTSGAAITAVPSTLRSMRRSARTKNSSGTGVGVRWVSMMTSPTPSLSKSTQGLRKSFTWVTPKVRCRCSTGFRTEKKISTRTTSISSWRSHLAQSLQKMAQRRSGLTVCSNSLRSGSTTSTVQTGGRARRRSRHNWDLRRSASLLADGVSPSDVTQRSTGGRIPTPADSRSSLPTGWKAKEKCHSSLSTASTRSLSLCW